MLVAPSACIQKDGTRYNPIATVVGEVSVEGERATGLAVDNMIQRQLPMIRDPSVLEFVNDLGLQIVRGIEPQPFARALLTASFSPLELMTASVAPLPLLVQAAAELE